MSDDLYCKVYVAGAADAAALKACITAATGQGFERRAVQVAGLLIEAFDNSRPHSDQDDDFVRWPVYLEVEPVDDGMAEPAFIAALARLLHTLNGDGLRTVVSCDFEDELAVARQDLS